MSRYYYTCPIQAAYMGGEFGVRVTRTHCYRGDGKYGESMQPVPMFIFGRDIENMVSDNVKYYITPESMHCNDGVPLLNARQWDVLRSNYWDTDLMADDGVFLCENDLAVISGQKMLSDGTHYILERDGKPFFMPEVEA